MTPPRPAAPPGPALPEKRRKALVALLSEMLARRLPPLDKEAGDEQR
jgi:hypothetical protein